MNKPNQKLKSGGNIPKEHILALSWNIACQPKLYQELASNPYSANAQQLISQRFPLENITDVIQAVVLAEPEGQYDRNFRKLTEAQQKKELSRQKDNATRINKRLNKYFVMNETELGLLPKNFIYTSMSGLIFETGDLKKIEQTYSQNQRRDFKLLIVNFIAKLDDDISPSVNEALEEKRALWQPSIRVAFAMFSFILLFTFVIYLIQTNSTTLHLQVNKLILGSQTQKERRELPVRLVIPAINVNTNIEPVGVNNKGEMEAPSNIADVGWFDLGPRPGEVGSSVIAGHFDGKNGEAGVFTNLYKLKKGDKLFIEDDKGVSTTFIVRESRIYDPGYAEEVFNQNDTSHLNLVTCDGVWNGVEKSYSKRLVVFADIEN